MSGATRAQQTLQKVGLSVRCCFLVGICGCDNYWALKLCMTDSADIGEQCAVHGASMWFGAMGDQTKQCWQHPFKQDDN